ncbi:MAG: hypothetical protein WAQ98_02700 [Blastocatellia bacterium]
MSINRSMSISTSISEPNANTNENLPNFNRFDLKVNWDEINAKLALDELTDNFDEAFSTLHISSSCCS